MNYSFNPKGVCSRQMDFEIEGTKILDVVFTGGCKGNLAGISMLLKGMEIDEVIERLDGVECGDRPTSCPDQIAQAPKEYKINNL